MVTAKTLSRQVWLLALLVGMEIINPLLAEATTGAHLLSTVLFIGVSVALITAVLRTKRQRYLGAALAVTALVLEIARNSVVAGHQQPMDALASIVIGAFFLFVFCVILSELLHAHRVGFNDVVGAFSGYILIALIWGRLYALVWMLLPHSFSISDDIKWQLGNWHTLHTLFDYYSLTILATVGYGDIATTTPASNNLVWLEVICGQFYLAVVVATVVGIKISQALAARGDDAGSS
jgi:voltage-gated potassium channel